ncbi:MAG: hypothetical protein IIC51_08200, partial [Planctomycetes bacterium]|nr:hypothetical protein [Planctomycetota bacterium]
DGQEKIVGDVTFDEVFPKAHVITPVPGGVGPVTVAILLRSAAEAARAQLTKPRRLDAWTNDPWGLPLRRSVASSLPRECPPPCGSTRRMGHPR